MRKVTISWKQLFDKFKDQLEHYYFYRSDLEETYEDIFEEVAEYRLKSVPKNLINPYYTKFGKLMFKVREDCKYIFEDIIIPETVYVFSFNKKILHKKNYINAIEKYLGIEDLTGYDMQTTLNMDGFYNLYTKEKNKRKILQIYKVPDYLQSSLFKENTYIISFGFLSFGTRDFNDVIWIINSMYMDLETGNVYIPKTLWEIELYFKMLIEVLNKHKNASYI